MGEARSWLDGAVLMSGIGDRRDQRRGTTGHSGIAGSPGHMAPA